ncbi:MAG: mechanosensitive ion channel, partial [Gammaproteobacteria bacterium]|nr:mechanosensitive ion channel [Gammaproteobacteria bacterium]
MSASSVLWTGTAYAQTETTQPSEDKPGTAGTLLYEASRYTAEFDKAVEQQQWDEQLAEWERQLQEVQFYVGSSQQHSLERSRYHASQIGEVRAQATAAKREIEKQPRSRLLDALGSAPGEGEPPDSSDIAAQRKQYANDISRYRAQIAQVEFVLTRVSELEVAVSAIHREWILEKLFKHYAIPLLPDVLAKAVPRMGNVITLLVRSPIDWYAGLTDEQRQNVLLYPGALVVVLASLVGWGLRRMLSSYCGRDPNITDPSYSRRLMAAIAEGVGRGLIPALIVAGFLFFISREGALISGLFYQALTSALSVLLFFLLVAALPHAVLAPDKPAWRLTRLSSDCARIISRRVVFLAAVVAIELFFDLVARDLVTSDELISVYGLVFIGLEALGIVSLTSARLWQVESEQGAPTDSQEEQSPDEGSRFWPYVRHGVALIAIAGAIAAAIGYTALGGYLVHNILFTAAVVTLALLIRGVLHELVSALVRWPLMRQKFKLRFVTLKRIKFWFTAAIDPVLVVAAVFLSLVGWGIRPTDQWRWIRKVLEGFTVGNVTISLADILLAVLVFIAAMAATRLLQRILLNRALPRTRLDLGARHALSAGVGYFGVILAVALAIAALGVSFTNVALIAGALSVGIGFGLQNIVNNFVSGFILLVERPIKVGDWVAVGTQEGFVKQISFRATELETFQKASIIIPNAEILSTAVVNLTHKDRYGRTDM